VNYLVLLVIILSCVILAVLVVTPLFRFSQMQSADRHLLNEFQGLAKENRDAILESRKAIVDLERRIEHTDAPPKGPDVPDVSLPQPPIPPAELPGETTVRKVRES
jgi:hypothetical protein